ncbi:MAG: hypothetical protein JXB48_10905 [Candidatus Latescibacteria bacterium]|nr:hypothetical protein [Candidatus Latescibacterota bacterium]
MIRRNAPWLLILFVFCSVNTVYTQENFLPGDKAEVILGPPDKTGVDIVKAGTNIIFKGICRDADTKFTIWRLRQYFGNITDLTFITPEAARELQEIENSFSQETALGFSMRDSEEVAKDLRFKLIEGRLVVSGFANNQEDIKKIENIAKIFDINPVINVEMRKDMIEIDAIFCRIARTDGKKFGTDGLQSAKIRVPRAGYFYQGANEANSGDAVSNKSGQYSSLSHEGSAGFGAETIEGDNIINSLTSHFRVTQNDVKVLIRPHLSTLNGQQAIFHSGGQQPFEIATNNVQTIEWKDYGTKLTIQPTLTTDSKIEVDVNIELTIPLYDEANRFTKFSHNGRAILNEDEALVLSGLVQQLYKLDIERTPLLGKIPILNFFFRLDDKSHDQEEMVVVVMPRRPSIADKDVESMMKGSDEMQKIIIDTAPSMGPVQDNPKNSRPFRDEN